LERLESGDRRHGDRTEIEHLIQTHHFIKPKFSLLNLNLIPTLRVPTYLWEDEHIIRCGSAKEQLKGGQRRAQDDLHS
jgi:hypothetical protein